MASQPAWASQNWTLESVTHKSRMRLKKGVLMAATAQANRVRHFELCFVEFAHSAEKLELGKSVSIFFPHTVPMFARLIESIFP